MAVHARPITTPGGVTSYNLSVVNIGFPTNSCNEPPSTVTTPLVPVINLRAAFL